MSDPLQQRLLTKSTRIQQEYEHGPLHPMLRKLLDKESYQAFVRDEWLWLVTCIYRSNSEDLACGGSGHGVHTVWRAADIRTNNIPDALVERTVVMINTHWRYDAKESHPVAIFERKTEHNTGEHLHLQVSDETKERA